MVNKFNKQSFFANILLLSAAIIWGLAFVAQDIVRDKMGSFTINAIRALVGSMFLFVFTLIKNRFSKKKEQKEKKNLKDLIIASVLCGIAFSFSYNLQQVGMSLYDEGTAVAGRAGFLTGLYVLFVPILSVLFLKKKLSLNVIISVWLACIGLYLLCFASGIENIYQGDFIILLCAIFFSIQILIVDKYTGKVDIFLFLALQLLVFGIISLILSLIFEKPSLEVILKNIFPLLYLGVLSSATANLFQIAGQNYAKNPTVSSIIMSFESVFALVGGVVILGDKPNGYEIMGCIIMFIAIVLSQIKLNKNNKTLSI